MSFGSKILKYQDEMLRDLAKLVAVPSVNAPALEGMPFGKDCADVLGLILKMAEDMGLKTANVGNYAGHAEYGAGDEVAAVVTHVDVVPAGDGWETDPFTMTEKGNCWYGRGTADDKGAAIAALYGLKVLKEEKVIGNRRIRAIFGSGEETGSNDLEMYFKSEQMPAMAFTPDAEYGICNREKGMMRLEISDRKNAAGPVVSFDAGTVINAVPARAEAVLSCSAEQAAALERAAKTAAGEFQFEKTADGVKIVSLGRASHAMQPQEGFNAASHLNALLAGVFSEAELGGLLAFLNRAVGTETDGASLGITCSDAESGPLTLNLGLLHIGTAGASAGIDIRYPVTCGGDEIFAKICAAAEKAGLHAELLAHNPPLFLPDGSKLIRLLQNSYAEIMGSPAELYSTGGGTYARELKGNCVAFGLLFMDEPDRRLHNTGEHIDTARFLQHAQICLEAMYRMLTV